MKKPPDVLIKLVDIGHIHTVTVTSPMTSPDSWEEVMLLKGVNGKVRGLWKSISNYIEFDVSTNQVARVKPECRKQVEAWHRYEIYNAADIALYNKLRIKLERA